MQGKNLFKAVRQYVEIQSRELGLQSRTIRNRRQSLSQLLYFLKNQPLNLKTSKAYFSRLATKGWQSSSINNEKRQVKAFINFLFKENFISENFSKDLTPLKVHRQQIPLIAPEIIEKIIEAGCQPGSGDNFRNRKIKRDMNSALKFMLRTGLRVSELCGLKGSDFRLDDETPNFTVTSKGGDREILPVPRDRIKDLRNRVKRERVFEVQADTLNKTLKRGAKKVGVTTRVHCHLLRHVYATSLLRQGVALQVTQRLLRHKNVEVTNRVYSHYLLEDLSLAQNSLKIIRDKLTPAEFFDSIVGVMEKLTKNEKYRLDVSRNSEEIILKIKLEKAS